MTELDVDGTLFSFPDGWSVSEFDRWPQYARPAGQFGIKGCDIVALDGDHLWIIEMKDYTYPGAQVPSDLSEEIGRKAVGTMGILFGLDRTIADSAAKEFSALASHSRSISIALHVEVKDGGRRREQIEPVLVSLKHRVRAIQRTLGLHGSLVTSTLAPAPTTPWTARRNPRTRLTHADR